MNLICLRGAPAAVAGATRVFLAPHIQRLPARYADRRFIAAMCLYSRAVDRGRAPRPYRDHAAEAFARAMLIDDQEFAAAAALPNRVLAARFAVPLAQVELKRQDLGLPGAFADSRPRRRLGAWQSAMREPSPPSEKLGRPLWSLTADQRVAAMRRGELTFSDLFAWARRAPQEIPTINGELEFVAWHLADNEHPSPGK